MNVNDLSIDNDKVVLLKYYYDHRNQKINKVPTGLRKQKYLFFYNAFSFVLDEKYNFNELKAFENGPVYSDVYSFVANNPRNYIEQMETQPFEINLKIAKITTFFLDSITDNELSAISHMDFWNKAFNRSDTTISKEDFSANDIVALENLYSYSKNIFEKKYEVTKNKNENIIMYDKSISEKVSGIIETISEECNPVILEESEGVIIVD